MGVRRYEVIVEFEVIVALSATPRYPEYGVAMWDVLELFDE